MNLKIKKTDTGDILMTGEAFEYILDMFDIQNLIHLSPESFEKDMQNKIDEVKIECRKILHQKIVLSVAQDRIVLVKKYEHQDNNLPWLHTDKQKIKKLFVKKYNWSDRELSNDDITDLGHQSSDPYQERIYTNAFFDNEYLVVLDDNGIPRSWTKEEMEEIENLLNQ
jgi:hypothetical protein